MRGFLLSMVGLVVASVSTAQVPASQSGKSNEKQPATCSVSGHVVTAAEGAPLKSAQVALIQEDATSHAQAFSATTDSDGRFEIRKIASGRYSFLASHSGYITQYYQARGFYGGTSLTFVPGQEIDGALFRLTRGAVITGRIVDESGEPMTKVAVASLRKLSAEKTEDSSARIGRDQLQAVSRVITDDRGEFRIFDLRAGEYYVQAAASGSFSIGDEDALGWLVRANLGSQYAPVYYPGVIQLDQAQSFVLAAGEEVRAEFAMRQVKTVQVAGRVVASDGKAATGTFVWVSPSDGDSWSEQASATTDAKGDFTIKGVAPGSYIINAQQRDQERAQFARQKLEVGNENIDSVLLAVGQGTTISGRVVGGGPGMPDRVHLQLEPVHESEIPGWGSAQSKPDGSFQVIGVPDGDYALRVYGMEQGWYIKSARLGGEDVLQKGLQVEKGSFSGTLEIVLSSSGAQLEGAVTDHDKPAGGAEVLAKPEPETPYNRMRSKSTTTDQNGHFTFRTLPPGKYRVTAKLASESSEAPAAASEPKVVTLGEHDHQTLQLSLAAPQSE